MKLVIVSDLHADWLTDGYERLTDVKDALAGPVMRAKLIAKKEHVVFICLGDVTNPGSRNHHRAVALIAETMMDLGAAKISNYWLIGNHDVIEDGHRSHVLMGLQGVSGMGACLDAGFPLTHIISEPEVHWLEGNARAPVLFLPYTPSAFPYDPADEVVRAAEQEDGIVAVMGHLSIPGILYQGSETTDMPRGRTMVFPTKECKRLLPKARLFNGHYHRRQVFDGITVPGSLVRLTHGEEANTNGYLVETL